MSTHTSHHRQGLTFLIIGFTALAVAMLFPLLTIPPRKAHALEFSPDLSALARIEYPGKYWLLSGYDTEYKNAILKKYQDMLTAEAIPKAEQRWYVAQLYQENGTLDPVRLGDSGCSLGIIQYNACAHDKINATQFLAKNPEWGTVDFQLRVMTKWVVDRRRIYKGNIKRIIIHHNSPACAVKDCSDTNVGYYAAISSKLSLLSSL